MLRHLKKCRNKFCQTLAKAKRDWAYHFASNVETNKVWSLNSWYRGIQRYEIPLISKPNGEKATSNTEKLIFFREAFFPEPPMVQTEQFDPENPLPNTRPFEDVTMREIDKHLRKTSNTSAPGLSGILYQAIKWAWGSAGETIHYILKWSLRLGVHHSDWKQAVMVIIPKPNKSSYSIPKAYCPIQLLECLGKLLEKIVAKRLMFDCSRYDLIPP